MGVLKKLTEEYFGNLVRWEEADKWNVSKVKNITDMFDSVPTISSIDFDNGDSDEQ